MTKKTFKTAHAMRKKAFVENVSQPQLAWVFWRKVSLQRLAKNSGAVRPSAKFPVAEYAAAEP